jgi:hypothetical protein
MHLSTKDTLPLGQISAALVGEVALQSPLYLVFKSRQVNPNLEKTMELLLKNVANSYITQFKTCKGLVSNTNTGYDFAKAGHLLKLRATVVLLSEQVYPEKLVSFLLVSAQ